MPLTVMVERAEGDGKPGVDVAIALLDSDGAYDEQTTDERGFAIFEIDTAFVERQRVFVFVDGERRAECDVLGQDAINLTIRA